MNSAKDNLLQTFFDVLLVYYWLYMIVSFIREPNLDFVFSVEYFALVLPILIFIAIFSPFIFKKGKLSKSSVAILIFVSITGLVSLTRIDIATFYNIAILSFTIIIIIEFRLKINIKIINILFILSIFFSIYSTFNDTNCWGFLPFHGTSERNNIRVSLFPYGYISSGISVSSFFSLFVAFINFFFNKKKSRLLFILIGIYFIVFSFNRTSLICILIVLFVLLLWKITKFRPRWFYGAIPLAIISILLILPMMSSFLLQRDYFKSDVLNLLFYKSMTGVMEPGDEIYAIASYRNLIWLEHLRLFTESPVIGQGTLPHIFEDYGYTFTGSESFFTGLLARIGLMILPFIFFFIYQFKMAFKTNNIALYCLVCIIPVIMLTYGSFIVPYNMLFLLIFGMINMSFIIKNDR